MNKGLFLSLAFILISFQAHAENAQTVSGTDCGTNCQWELKNGVLTVSTIPGVQKATMVSSKNMDVYPWKAYLKDINKIVISDGVENIGTYAFRGANATEVHLSDSVKTLSMGALSQIKAVSITLPKNITGIDGEVFSSSAIKVVNIPASVTEFSYGSQLNGTYIEKILIEEGSTVDIEKFSSGAHNKSSIQVLTYQKEGDEIFLYDSENNLQGVYQTIDNMMAGKVVTSYQKYDEKTDSLKTYNGYGVLLSYTNKNPDGSVYTYDKDGKLIFIRGKKIYTIDEAIAVTEKGSKNTFTIRYR